MAELSGGGSVATITSAKTVIRCRDFAKSHEFYGGILGFAIVDEWEESGGKGAIFAPDPSGTGGYIEIYELYRSTPRFREAFARPVASDKIDLQLRTPSVDDWVRALDGKWAFEGPEALPWGQRWIKLRDPDGFLIAIYEGQV